LLASSFCFSFFLIRLSPPLFSTLFPYTTLFRSILGLNRLLAQQKYVLYYVSLTILFIQNYYFGYMVAIFLTLYFLVQLSKNLKWRVVGRQFLDFTVMSIAAGLSS